MKPANTAIIISSIIFSPPRFGAICVVVMTRKIGRIAFRDVLQMEDKIQNIA
jgi:hypothetical protein